MEQAMQKIDEQEEEKMSHFSENNGTSVIDEPGSSGLTVQGDCPVDSSGTKCLRRIRILTNLSDYGINESSFTVSYEIDKEKLTIGPEKREEIRATYRKIARLRRNEAYRARGDTTRCLSKISAKPTTGAPGFLSFGLMVLLIFFKSVRWTTTAHSWYDNSRCGQYDQVRCHNGGTSIDTGENFVCECPDGYYGDDCGQERYSSKISRWMSSLSFRPKSVTPFQDHLRWLTGKIADTGNDDRGRELAVAMTRTRILPINRRSLYCSPHENVPSLDSVYRQVSRKREPFRRWSPFAFMRHARIQNTLYHAFYQYFMLQFFDADFNPTVTGSQLYGADEKTRSELRSFVDGKLKTELLNGEHYPVVSSWYQRLDAIANTKHWSDRLETTRSSSGPWWTAIARIYRALVGNPSRATGHRLLAADPLLFAVSTLWVREHNRVCDELASRWPSWTDDELHATAKRTVVGEMMAMMMNDVLRSKENALPATQYDPEAWGDRVQDEFGRASTPFELLLSVMLPATFDDKLTTEFRSDDDGLDNVVANDAIGLVSDLRIGSAKTTSDNGTAATKSAMTKLLMTLARENSAQNFNAYRRHFGLGAYESFDQFTAGDWDAADGLESLYGHVDNVELVAGMMAERKGETDGVVPTFQLTTKSFVMNSIMNNPLNGKTVWKSETFGGDYGFDTVKSVDVRTFIRRNINNEWGDDDDIKQLIYV